MGYRRAANLDKNIIFAEYFNSEHEVRRNGGLPTDVTFNEGVASLNGSSSWIDLQSPVSLPQSIRMIFTAGSSFAGEQQIASIAVGNITWILFIENSLICAQQNTQSTRRFKQSIAPVINTKYDIIVTWDGVPSSTNIYIYINGVDQTLAGTEYQSAYPSKTAIGSMDGSSDWFNGSVELLEGYNKQLTAEEVQNIYNDSRYSIPNLNHDVQAGVEIVDQQDMSNADWIKGAVSVSWDGAENTCDAVGAGGYSYNVRSVTGGEEYQFLFKCKNIDTPTTIEYAVYDHTNSAWIVSAVNYQSLINTSTYTQIRIYFTAPATCTQVRIYTIRSLPTGNSVYIKDISLKLSEVRPISNILHVTAKDGVIRNLLSGGGVGSLSYELNQADSYAAADCTFNWDSDEEAFKAVATSSSARVSKSGVLVDGKHVRVIAVVKGTNLGAYPSTYPHVYDGSTYVAPGNARNYNGEYQTFIWEDIIRTGATTITFRFGSPTAVDSVFYLKELTVEELIPDTVNASIDVFKDGDIRTKLFNGSTSKLDCGDYNDIIGDVTFLCWIKPYSEGEASNGTIIDNGKFQIKTGGTYRIYIYSDGSTLRFTAQNVINRNNWFLISVTRKASGTTSLWINDIKIIDELSSGVPAAGTTNIIIGNNSAGSRCWDGLISEAQLISGLLTGEELSQYYTATKHKYNK